MLRLVQPTRVSTPCRLLVLRVALWSPELTELFSPPVPPKAEVKGVCPTVLKAIEESWVREWLRQTETRPVSFGVLMCLWGGENEPRASRLLDSPATSCPASSHPSLSGACWTVLYPFLHPSLSGACFQIYSTTLLPSHSSTEHMPVCT